MEGKIFAVMMEFKQLECQPEKELSFNRNQTNDLYGTGVLLYQLTALTPTIACVARVPILFYCILDVQKLG